MNEQEPKSGATKGHLLRHLAKIVSISIASVLMLMVVLVLVAKYTISDRTWLAIISTVMVDKAGYAMEVNGNVSFNLSLHTTFEATGRNGY